MLGLSPGASYHQVWEKRVKGQTKEVKGTELGLGQPGDERPAGCLTEQAFGEPDAQTSCDPDFHIDG